MCNNVHGPLRAEGGVWSGPSLLAKSSAIFKSISKFSSTWSPKFSGLRLYTTYKTQFNAIWNNLHNRVRAAFVRCWFCMMVMPLGLGINPMFAGRYISVRGDAGVTLTQHYEWLEINHPNKSGTVFRFSRRTFSGKSHQSNTVPSCSPLIGKVSKGGNWNFTMTL